MELFKNYKNKIIPTCLKEALEKRNNKTEYEDKERMIKDIQPVQEAPSIIPIYKSAAPYPELVDIIPSRSNIKQLKMLATGKMGELTAILTYLYQEYILFEDYTKISKELEQIAIVEMKHYELISNAIVEFGGDPNLTNGMGDIWTGRNISTEKNAKKILIDNIRLEEGAIRDYQKAAKETNNESLARLYLRIVEDEKLHSIILNNLLEMLIN